jgi:hypothetical protein
MTSKIRFDVCVTRGIFVLCHHIIVNLFVRKPELNGENFPNFDLNSCHFCPSFFCPPTVLWRTINLGQQISDISKKSMQATIYCHYD